MKKYFLLSLIVCLLFACSSQKISQQKTAFSPDEQLKVLTQKALKNIDLIELDSMNIPRSVKADGSIYGVKTRDWTSGFYAGTFWGLYRFSGE